MRSVFLAMSICLATAACAANGAKKATSQVAQNNAVSPATALSAAPGSLTRVTANNPSTAIVDVNRSVPQQLGPNSPPPSSFENSCAPEPYVFQSKAGYEAVRVKDCRNDQLVYLPNSAQAQIGIYADECRRRCGGR